MTEFAFIFAGFVVGAIVGLTGVGGGSLMTPLLIFGFGVKPLMAVGTDLLFAAITKFTGSVNFARARLVDWPIVLRLSLGSVPAALATIYALHRYGAASDSTQGIITSTLGVALLLTAASTLYKAWRSSARTAKDGASTNLADTETLATVVSVAKDASQTPRPILTIVLGAVIGAMVALTSVGAGAIGVTALMLLYPRLPLPRIVAADIAYAVPLTLVAGLGHASIGSVDWRMLGLLLLGSIPGIWLGSQYMNRIPEKLTRSLLALLLAYAGSKLLLF